MAIKIKAKNKGKFTASAKKAGKSVQQHAHDVMDNPNATPLQRKRANFAIQAKKWKHDLGGPAKYEDGGGQKWDNLMTNPNQSSAGVGQPQKSNAGAAYGTAFASNLASSIPQITNTFTNPNATKADKVAATTGAVGDAAVSAVPGFGAFYGTARGITSSIQNAMPGEYKKDAETGVTRKVYKSNAAAAFDQWLTPDHTHASNSWALAAAADNSKDKAKYALMGIGDLFGVTKIARAAQAGLGKNPEGLNLQTPMSEEQKANLSFGAKPTTNSEIQSTTPEDFMNNGGSLRSMSKYNHGGQLEHYNLPLHSQMADNWANAQLDGKPVQINAKETIFRKENGGDYVFSDNPKMLNPETGNTFAQDSKKIEKSTQKPFYDKASLNTKKYQLDALSKVNDNERSKVESKMYGGVPKALRGLNGEEIVTTNTPGTMDWSGKPLYELPVENLPQMSGKVETTQSLLPMSAIQGNFNKVPNASIPPTTNTTKPNNNLTTGDYLQLAGQVPALGYNLARAFEKPEKQKLYLDRTPITQQSIAKNYNPTYLAMNAAYKGIDEGTTSDAVRRASKISALSAIAPKLQEYDLAVDNANQTLRGQYEDKISGQNRFNIGQRFATDDVNARNREAVKAFGAAATTQLGQGLTEFGKAKNNARYNNLSMQTLKEISSAYGVNLDEAKEMLNFYFKKKG